MSERETKESVLSEFSPLRADGFPRLLSEEIAQALADARNDITRLREANVKLREMARYSDRVIAEVNDELTEVLKDRSHEGLEAENLSLRTRLATLEAENAQQSEVLRMRTESMLQTENEYYRALDKQRDELGGRVIALEAENGALRSGGKVGARPLYEGVVGEIMAERERQIAKGFDAAHDDTHDRGEIAGGAIAKVYAAVGRIASAQLSWPWLVDATAMLVAEIERQDPADPRPVECETLADCIHAILRLCDNDVKRAEAENERLTAEGDAVVQSLADARSENSAMQHALAIIEAERLALADELDSAHQTLTQNGLRGTPLSEFVARMKSHESPIGYDHAAALRTHPENRKREAKCVCERDEGGIELPCSCEDDCAFCSDAQEWVTRLGEDGDDDTESE